MASDISEESIAISTPIIKDSGCRGKLRPVPGGHLKLDAASHLSQIIEVSLPPEAKD